MSSTYWNLYEVVVFLRFNTTTVYNYLSTYGITQVKYSAKRMYVSDTDATCDHKEAKRSKGHIMVTSHYVRPSKLLVRNRDQKGGE